MREQQLQWLRYVATGKCYKARCRHGLDRKEKGSSGAIAKPQQAIKTLRSGGQGCLLLFAGRPFCLTVQQSTGACLL